MTAFGETSTYVDGNGVTHEAKGVRVLPEASATIMSAQTAATGTNWTTFASQACAILDMQNFTGTAIEYRRGGAGSAFRIPDGGQRRIVGITNANEISVRRVDTSNTQVTVAAEALS